jgi:hypothetical protein
MDALLMIAAKQDFGPSWCSSFGKLACSQLGRGGFLKWIPPGAIDRFISYCLATPVTELTACLAALASEIPLEARTPWIVEQLQNLREMPQSSFMLIEKTSNVPPHLAEEWLGIIEQAILSPDPIISTAAMNALRVFHWTESAAHVFLRGLDRLDQRPQSYVTAALTNAAQILASNAPSGYQQAGSQGLYEGRDWQVSILKVAHAMILETAPFLRVLVPRVKRDGETAELYRDAIPFFVGFFKLAALLLKHKFEQVEEVVPLIMEAAIAALNNAFDVPEIIEMVIRTLTMLATHESARMAVDPVCIWMPLSIIMTADFSPLDKHWIPAINALLRYHQALGAAQPAFYRTIEGAIGQFMEPLRIVQVFRDCLLSVPAPDSVTPPITQALAQAYVQLHAQALSFGWPS